jgi:uncharacterized phage protein (TIGR01671 family)
MNREIKFRGKRIDNGEWVYGSLVLYPALEHPIIICKKHKHGDQVNEVQVKRETVGQYTGLKDKHGKEIYEGDILKVKLNYEEAEMGVVNWCASTGSYNWVRYYLHEVLHESEIIGNIHENPEPLGGKQ